MVFLSDRTAFSKRGVKFEVVKEKTIIYKGLRLLRRVREKREDAEQKSPLLLQVRRKHESYKIKVFRLLHQVSLRSIKRSE